MGRNNLLPKSIIKQFDYNKYKQAVIDFLDLIEILKYQIGNLDVISITQKYEMRISGFNGKLTTSKIESFLIKDYDNEEKLTACLKKYENAFNQLNDQEKIVFAKTFVEKAKSDSILEELDTYADQITIIRKSAVIKFSLMLGFDRFVDKLYK